MRSSLFKLVIIITLTSSEILNSITGFVQGLSQESSPSLSIATNDTKETISTPFSSPSISSSSALSMNALPGSSLAALGDNTLNESSSPSSSASAIVNAAYLTSKDASDLKQDQLSQASTASVQHQQHPNHQNHHQNHQSSYSIDLYPGASSYTSSATISTPSPSSSSQNQSTSSYASVSQPQFSSFNSENNIGSFSNSYGNQAAQLDRNQMGSSNSVMAENHNHNYGTQTKGGATNGGSSTGAISASLNTGLIQNLTASLFPIKQLSNATLFTLSELLNKTRQSGTHSQFTNGYKPTFNLAYPTTYFSTQSNQPSYGGASSSSSSSSSSNPSYSNPLAASTNYPGLESSTLGNIEQQYNLFDYIRPSQFGFRQSNQATRFHPQAASSAASIFRHSSPTNSGTKTTSSGQHQQYSNSYGTSLPSQEHYLTASDNGLYSRYKTSSNIYNTYIPFKENIDPLPTMTNGQALNMALYGFKLPLLMNNNKPFSATSSSNNNNQNIGSGYQFIQHHNLNNQDHLDKIVYHSTPFRPSIVSPPISAVISNNQPNTTPSSTLTSSSPAPSLAQSNQALKSSSSLTSSASSSHTSSNNDQRSKSSSSPDSLDTKLLAFGSLSSSSSAISDSKSDYTTNGQANNASKYSSYKDSSNARAGGSENYSKGSNDKTTTTTTSTMSPLSGDNDSGSLFDGLRNNSTIEKMNHGLGSHTLTHGQEMLFDLYEREIDNQIRDALYNEAPVHMAAESVIPGNTKPPHIAADWFEKSAQTLYEDPSGVEQASSSWERPVSLGSHGSAYMPTASTGSATRTRAQPPPIHSDPLAEALQDLPTFSATDLQPIFPSGPAYSLITSPSLESSTYHDTQPAQTLTSSLSAQLFPLINQHHNQNPIGLESELINKYTPLHQHNSAHSMLTLTPASTPPTSSSQPLSLQSLLFKLHTSPLSSLLSSPLTHLYSSLPKSYKHNKKPPSSSLHKSNKNHHNQNNQQQTLLNHITSPSSLFSTYTLGGITGKQLLNAISNGNSLFDTLATAAAASSSSHKIVESPKSTNQQNQQQQRQRQQAAIAAATANFLAAADDHHHQSSMNPYQSALLQTQANNIFLNPAATETSDLAMIGRTTLPGRIVSAHSSPFAETSTHHHSNGALTGFGLTGGGITPMIWRSIFSPANWARKQSTSSSGQSGNQLQNSNNNHQPLLQASNLSPSILHSLSSSSPQINSVALQGSQKSSGQQTSGIGGVVGGSGSDNVGGSALNLAISYNKQQLPQLNSIFGNQSPGLKGINQKRPEIKIKILKIPVAYYDQAPSVSTATTTGGGGGLTSSSLAPGQMQPAITASLLSALPCPLHHNTIQPAHSLEQHIANQASSISHGSTSSFPVSATSILSPTATTTATLHSSSNLMDSPISIQGFTDINQPNDLQVSHSGKLLKILQQAAAVAAAA